MTEKYESDYVDYKPKSKKKVTGYHALDAALQTLGDNNCNNWHNLSINPDSHTEFTECICGKKIKNVYTIKHNTMYITAQIGSKCIKQFLGDDILKQTCTVCASKLKRKHKSGKCKSCRFIAWCSWH